jgi:inhibitor of KinA sporulation pathway (predicted exonuclease)
MDNAGLFEGNHEKILEDVRTKYHIPEEKISDNIFFECFKEKLNLKYANSSDPELRHGVLRGYKKK